MKKKNRSLTTQLIIIGLVFILCFSMLPTTIFAAEPPNTHSDQCYTQQLICNQEETQSTTNKSTIGENQEHVHKDSCYQSVLSCNQDIIEQKPIKEIDIDAAVSMSLNNVRTNPTPNPLVKENATIMSNDDLDPVDIRFSSNSYLEGQENPDPESSWGNGITINYSFTNDGSTDRKIVISYPKKYAGNDTFPFLLGQYPQTIDGGEGTVEVDTVNRTLTYTVSNSFVGIGAFEIFPEFYTNYVNTTVVRNLRDDGSLSFPDCEFNVDLYVNNAIVKQDDFLLKWAPGSKMYLDSKIATDARKSYIYEHDYNVSPFLTDWQLPKLTYKNASPYNQGKKWPIFNEDIEVTGFKVYTLDYNWKFDETVTNITYGTDSNGDYAIIPINQTILKGQSMSDAIQLLDLKLDNPTMWQSDLANVVCNPMHAPIMIAKYGNGQTKEYPLTIDSSYNTQVTIVTCEAANRLKLNYDTGKYVASSGQNNIPLNVRIGKDKDATYQEVYSSDKHGINDTIYTTYDFSGDLIQPQKFYVDRDVPGDVIIEYVVADRDGSNPQTVKEIITKAQRPGGAYTYTFPAMQDNKTITSVNVTHHLSEGLYGIDYEITAKMFVQMRTSDSRGKPITAQKMNIPGRIWSDTKPAQDFIEEFDLNGKCGFAKHSNEQSNSVQSIGVREPTIKVTFKNSWTNGYSGSVKNPVIGIKESEQNHTSSSAAANLSQGGVMRYITGLDFTDFNAQNLDGWVIHYTTNLNTTSRTVKAKDYANQKFLFTFEEGEWLTGELTLQYENSSTDNILPYPGNIASEDLPLQFIMHIDKGSNFEGDLLQYRNGSGGGAILYFDSFARHDGDCDVASHKTDSNVMFSEKVTIRAQYKATLTSNSYRYDIYQGNKASIDFRYQTQGDNLFYNAALNTGVYNYKSIFIEMLDSRFFIASDVVTLGTNQTGRVEVVTIGGKRYAKITPIEQSAFPLRIVNGSENWMIKGLNVYASPTAPVGDYSNVFGNMYMQFAGDEIENMADSKLDAVHSGISSTLTSAGSLHADTLGLVGDGDTTTERMFIMPTSNSLSVKLNATTGTRLQPAANGVYGEIDIGKIVFETDDVNHLGTNIYKISANTTAYDYDSVVRLPVKDESVTAGSGSGQTTYTHQFGMYMTGPIEIIDNQGNEGLKITYELRSNQGTFVNESNVTDWSQVTAIKIHYDKLTTVGSNIFYMPLRTVGKPAVPGDKSYLVPVYQYATTQGGTPIGTIAGTAVTFEYKEADPDPKYDLIYDLNGGDLGTGPAKETGLSTGIVQPLNSTTIPTRTGYTFLGWSENMNATTEAEVVGSVKIGATDCIVYGVWKQIPPDAQFTVTYHDTGSTGGAAPIDANSPYLVNSEVSVLGNIGNLTKTGSVFKGWATTPNAVTADYTVEQITAGTAKFNMVGNMDLYPVWEAIIYTVTYHDTNATSGTAPVDTNGPYTENSEVTVLDNTGNLMKTNYIFKGWSTVPNAVTAEFSVEQIAAGTAKFNITNHTDLYPVWHGAFVPITFHGTKTLTEDGLQMAIQEGQFTFHIAADAANDASGYTGFTAGGKDVTTAETFTFDEINFVKVGTYHFIITEENKNVIGYTYDVNPVTATVEVVQNTTSHALEIQSLTYTKDGQPVAGITFHNTYTTPSASAITLGGSKTLTGSGKATANIEAGQFTFHAEAGAANDTTGYSGFTAGDVDVNAGGGFTFGTIEFTKVGTYTFVITENNLGVAGYTYDDKEVVATVTVTQNIVTNNLEANVVYTINGSVVDAVTFANTYHVKPITVDPPVEKVVNGTPSTNATFAFKMQAVNSTAGLTPQQMPMPTGSQNGEKIATIQGAGSVEFGSFTYTQAGTYVYQITEVAGNTAGYSYDTTVYTITDVVTDVNGQLAVVRSISNGTEETEKAVFTNIYKNPESSKPNQDEPEAPKTDDPKLEPTTKSEEPQIDESKTNQPDTGDTTSVILYVSLIILSIVTITGVIVVGKRKYIRQK